MRFIVIPLFVLGLGSILSGQDYQQQLATAQQLYSEGKYPEAGQILLDAFEQRSPRTMELELAMSTLAQAKRYDAAFAVMELGVNSGWLTLDYVLNDPTLATLYEDPRWEEQTQRLARFSIGENKALRNRLATIAERDQYYRQQMAEVAEQDGWDNPVIAEMYALQQGLDSLNYLEVNEMIETHGYPGRSMVGPQGSTAFLVIQRAPRQEQLKHLPRLRTAADEGELLWSDLAFLIDKLRMQAEQPQLYGTQVVRAANGLPTFYPIETPSGLNERRKRVHLMPIEDYAAKFGISWEDRE